MIRNPRSLVVVLLLTVAALLVAACGGAATPAAAPAAGAATPTMEPLPAEVLAKQLAAYTGQVGVLQAPNDTLERPLNLVGITQAVALTGGNPPCPGYVDTAPDYVFDLATDLPKLTVSFVGTDLSTLMVVTPGGSNIFCTDEESQEITLTPSLELTQPAQGRYIVYVGRGNMSGANSGKLTVAGQ
ncbi:MAG TPA: hypothetical protein PKM78_02655 [Anaerolineae bacterium]|nr:hypothetical protein [Anaerolineae bacterium]HNU03429.1 hypothetical protein [Anaerolineae bacterium]